MRQIAALGNGRAVGGADDSAHSARAASQWILRRSVASRSPRRVMYLPSSRSASLWLTVSSRGPPPPPLAEPQSSDVRAGESVTNVCEEDCANIGTEEENVDLAMPAAEPAAADAPVMCLESAPAISNMPRRSQSKRRRMSSSQRISRPS